ncbi:MAG TPA: phosphatase PAP2 family protein [Bacteroidota bacterium]|nr:phosphatase PAP2 family protein [Bacteroidota bacterium]
MSDFLYSIDKAVFIFINRTIANPFLDWLMPPLTDWNKSWVGLSIFGGLWLLLMILGGRKGRIVGLMLVPLIFLTDQVNSNLVKFAFHRLRPCHVIDGKAIVEQVRLLVDCGSGYSFPSSHAVNNFGFAVLMSFYYRRWAWLFVLYAFLMALSRVVVGVHYPSDVLGGALIGAAFGLGFVYLWESLGKLLPIIKPDGNSSLSAQDGSEDVKEE